MQPRGSGFRLDCGPAPGVLYCGTLTVWRGILYERPQADEYADYYRQYADLVPDGDVLEFMEHQQEAMRQLLGTLNEDQADYKYAAGKWTLKEVLGHIMDTERIFCIRALAFARQDPADLPGFEQDDYVTNGYFPSRTLRD